MQERAVYIQNQVLQIHVQKDLIFIILLNSKIPLCGLKRGMVIDIHQNSRLRAGLPCVVPEGFPQGMAADVCLEVQFLPGGFDHPKRLGTAEMVGAGSAGKEKIRGAQLLQTVFVYLQCFPGILVQCNLRLFSCFAFPDYDVLQKMFFCKIVNILPV